MRFACEVAGTSCCGRSPLNGGAYARPHRYLLQCRAHVGSQANRRSPGPAPEAWPVEIVLGAPRGSPQAVSNIGGNCCQS